MIWKFITFFVRKLEPEIAHTLTIKFFDTRNNLEYSYSTKK